jgi:hypothetical protein
MFWTLCHACGLISELVAYFVAFNLWIGTGFIFESCS